MFISWVAVGINFPDILETVRIETRVPWLFLVSICIFFLPHYFVIVYMDNFSDGQCLNLERTGLLQC